jgi:hypothetical protein
MTDLEKFKDDFKDLPPILYELLIKHYNLDQVGCITRAYKEYYKLMKNKECTLLDFYHTEDLKHLRVEPEVKCKIEFSKDYFLSNKFVFEKISENENVAYFKNHNISFYIIQNVGSGGDYDCCASIVLRYF